MESELLQFNGINAKTGDYLLELSEQDLVKAATGEALDPRVLSDLKGRHAAANVSHFGVKEGVDPQKLEETGWAIVFPFAAPDSQEHRRQEAIREALRPLLDLRKKQASAKKERYYRELVGAEAYRPNATKQEFLKNLNVAPGPADPEKLPYYLLLIGTPEQIPYRVQSQLGVQYAVGRLDFDTIEEYANYARSVVASESLAMPRRAGFFGVSNPDDAATRASAQFLLDPLMKNFADGGWAVESYLREGATRSSLEKMLENAPPFFFAASHGMGFPNGDPLQLRHQGALLCQDWPGPKQWRKPIPEEFYFAGEHLKPDAKLLGSIGFFFACYGLGTPQLDEFAKQAFKERAQIAPNAFSAALPKAMLGRPQGGALAIVGHVERAWGHSFLWAGKRGNNQQTEVFESTLRALMKGSPVGAAMEYFDERYAELSSDLSVQLEELSYGAYVDEFELAGMWTANNDARGYAILGDPAVRLRFEEGEVRDRAGAWDVVGVTNPELLEVEEQVIPMESATPSSSTLPSENTDSGPTIESFGFVDRLMGREETPAPVANTPKEPGAIERFTKQLTDTLSKAISDTTSLEVSTWVTSDLEKARFENGKMLGAELRAYTRVSLDGDTVVCLPQKDGEVDKEVWDIHRDMVEQAQKARTELMQSLVAAATSFLSITK